jgi:DNA-binding MurR/RpiR family transcriptional regulator
LWPATAAGHPEKIKALKDMYRLLDNALIGSKHQPGLLSVKEGDLAEITLEDEKVIFAEMIRETAQSLSQTHNTLTPVQQEAYENLLMQAASSLSDRRENNRHR